MRVPSEKQESQRLLSRTRQELVEERTAIQNPIRLKCHQMGLLDADDRRQMSHKLVKQLLKSSPSQELKMVVEVYWQVWKTLDVYLKKLEARILSNELGDLSQFNNERQLFSYTGLTPSEQSSGESVRLIPDDYDKGDMPLIQRNNG